MDSFIKCYPAANSESYHDIETYAGTAVLYYSQGADKVHLYNILIPFGHIFAEKDKISEYSPDVKIPASPTTVSSAGWWMLLTTVGSYEKLMTMNRKVLVTYQDVTAHWRGTDNQLPLKVLIGGKTGAVRIGMGDVPEGATATLRLGIKVIKEEAPPIVYINSVPAKFIGVSETDNTIRTTYDIASYEIPESALNDMYIVAEISPNPAGRSSVEIDYADVYIEPAK